MRSTDVKDEDLHYCPICRAKAEQRLDDEFTDEMIANCTECSCSAFVSDWQNTKFNPEWHHNLEQHRKIIRGMQREYNEINKTLTAERDALKARLEISDDHGIDGIEARDATIKGLEKSCDALKAENERLRGGLKRMREECFDDSEWAQIIDKALQGGE